MPKGQVLRYRVGRRKKEESRKEGEAPLRRESIDEKAQVWRGSPGKRVSPVDP